MKTKWMATLLFLVCGGLGLMGPASLLAAEVPYTHDPNVAEEVRVRDGLPNVFAKLTAGQPVRIAYLGGSITAAAGWRPLTLAWFKSQFPKAEVVEINAAISGTGSDYGACRLQTDVLAQKPDLVFMEHRVNGGGGYEAKSVEGIVRQVWKHSPLTDICLVYTVWLGMRKELDAGKQTWFGAIMENVANNYGIPSIDLGGEVVRRERAGSLLFKNDVPVAGKLVFSHDGVHPGIEGHEVYRDVIARSILAMQGQGKPGPHRLPVPLDARCWESGQLVPVQRAVLSAGWQAVDVKIDPVYRDDFGRTDAMLRGAVKCDKAGETITVKWNGTTIGFSDIPQGNEIEIEILIDQAPAPIVMKRTQYEMAHRYARFFYLPEQAPGPHTAVLRVKHLPPGVSYYAGQILVVGQPLP